MNFERELDQFYTNKDIALQCYELLKGLLKEHNIKPSIWLEPSAGAGAFFLLLKKKSLALTLILKLKMLSNLIFLNMIFKMKNTLLSVIHLLVKTLVWLLNSLINVLCHHKLLPLLFLKLLRKAVFKIN